MLQKQRAGAAKVTTLDGMTQELNAMLDTLKESLAATYPAQAIDRPPLQSYACGSLDEGMPHHHSSHGDSPAISKQDFLDSARPQAGGTSRRNSLPEAALHRDQHTAAAYPVPSKTQTDADTLYTRGPTKNAQN